MLDVATGVPAPTIKGIPPVTTVPLIVGDGVNKGKGVSVGGSGVAVLVGGGVKVNVGSSVGRGVQVGGRTLRGVGVEVGKEMAAGKVGGGNGFNPEYGLMKIVRNTIVIHITVIKIKTVRILIITAEVFLSGPASSR